MEYVVRVWLRCLESTYKELKLEKYLAGQKQMLGLESTYKELKRYIFFRTY